MNDNRVFIDTNIFVYAKLEHEHTKIKRQVASQLLKSINWTKAKNYQPIWRVFLWEAKY